MNEELRQAARVLAEDELNKRIKATAEATTYPVVGRYAMTYRMWLVGQIVSGADNSITPSGAVHKADAIIRELVKTGGG